MNDGAKAAKTTAIMELTSGYGAYTDASAISVSAGSEAPAITPTSAITAVLTAAGGTYAFSKATHEIWNRTWPFGC
ncbi:LxmA leader domain family RiPP [Nonomuraea sp. NPDC000554]|uniref:LxmA leader domain family RiPP n=1 Tax=Nonomuraea sp. NPDC000554 TaxID=3154259 RepID=UPI00332F431C